MPIFDSSKSIFIHIPKCGGTSLVTSFSPEIKQLIARPNKFSLKYMYGRNLQHATASKVRLLAPVRYARYYKFSLVRNPWDRMISEYNWRKQWDTNLANTNFINMLENIPKYRDKREPHFYQASDFIMDKNDNLLIDYLGYFENIDHEFEHICKQLNLDLTLARKNVSSNQSAEQLNKGFYGKVASELIKQHFPRDIANFGYQSPGS